MYLFVQNNLRQYYTSSKSYLQIKFFALWYAISNRRKDGSHMKEAIQTLITSDKMAHAFEYLKQDEEHTIDQQIWSQPFRWQRGCRNRMIICLSADVGREISCVKVWISTLWTFQVKHRTIFRRSSSCEMNRVSLHSFHLKKRSAMNCVPSAIYWISEWDITAFQTVWAAKVQFSGR